jgi:hypothetical protein
VVTWQPKDQAKIHSHIKNNIFQYAESINNMDSQMITHHTQELQQSQNSDNDDFNINDEYLLPLNLLNDDDEEMQNNNNLNEQPLITQQKDNLPFGEQLQSLKAPDAIRIFLKNINGIKNYNSWDSLTEACYHLHEHSVDFIGITETNINWNEKIRSDTRQKFQQNYQSALISTSSSTDPTKTNYQPGGTATIITDKYTGRSVKHIVDLSGMGRWSGIQMKRNTNSNLNIITAYRPIVTQGIHTCYQQHMSILRNKGINNPNPRQQILDDLTVLINGYNDNNDTTILMMDANEGLFTNNSKLTTFLAQTNLTSLIQHPQNHPATHSRGTQCIDYIFGTNTLIDHVIQSGLTPFYENPWPSTDHRGLFIDIHYLGLIGASTHSILPRTPKRISSLSKTMVNKFINTLEKTNRLPQILEELNNLHQTHHWTIQEHNIVEKIDTEFTNILLTAEKECSTRTQYP